MKLYSSQENLRKELTMKLLKKNKKKVNIVESYGCTYTCSSSQVNKHNAHNGSACGK